MTDAPRPTVLVIDNHDGVRQVLAAMVERLGYAARTAAGGAEGIKVYDRHPGDTAAVLLDVRMPDLDGPQTLALLRERNPDLPCVFVTGGYSHYCRDDLEGRGARVVFKPVLLKELEQTLLVVTATGAGPPTGRACSERSPTVRSREERAGAVLCTRRGDGSRTSTHVTGV